MKADLDRSDPVKVLSDREFEQLSEFIRAHCGVKMPAAKKPMLEARLLRRLRVLGLSSFREYCDILARSSCGADELIHMVDAVTTHKTDFFREPAHFQFLTETVLPEYVETCEQSASKRFALWSAGCSTGEEPYTLAIVLNEFAARNRGFQFAITATDISAKVLEKAQLGIYEQGLVTAVPPHLRQRYFMRSKEREKGLVRIVPELRSLVRFMRINLMDERFMPFEEGADAIFCRNVIIYFHRETQYRLLNHFCRTLKSGGHLFLGHSETVHGFELPLVRTGSTIYRKLP
jgi:chemotaxis protein methyltransferase CheR